MAEGVASRHAAHLVDKVERFGPIEVFDQIVARGAGRGFKGVESEFAPDDRSGFENVARILVQGLDHAPDEFDDAARDRQPDGHRRRIACEVTFARHLPKDLAQEERIAFRHFVQAADQLPVGRDSPSGLDELVDGVLFETGQRKGDALSLGLREQRGVLVRLFHLQRAIGADCAGRHVSDVTRKRNQHQQGRRVGGVQVVQHDQQRLSLRSVHEERDQGVEQPESRLLRLAQQSARQFRDADPLPQFRRDLRNLRGARSHPVRNPGRLDAPRQSTQNLNPGPVRRRSAMLPASAPEHAQAFLPGVRRRLLGEPALADPGFAREREQAAATRNRAVDSASNLGQLAAPADERLPAANGVHVTHTNAR